MDAWTLGLSEGMRFWANSGLHHILCDQDVSIFDVPRESQNVLQNVQRAPVAPSRPGWNEPKKRSQQPVRNDKSHKPDNSSSHQERQDAVKAAAPAAAKPAPPRFEESDAALAVFPYEQFRQRLRVPSRTVWTYWDLGHDFGAHPDDGRRDLFGTILQHLQWPRGSFTFWPLNFEFEGGLKAQAGQFWRGVGEAGADTVFCFGERAFKALFPRKAFGPAPVQRGNVLVRPLPGPTAMLAGDKDAKRIVWQALKGHDFRV